MKRTTYLSRRRGRQLQSLMPKNVALFHEFELQLEIINSFWEIIASYFMFLERLLEFVGGPTLSLSFDHEGRYKPKISEWNSKVVHNTDPVVQCQMFSDDVKRYLRCASPCYACNPNPESAFPLH
jgi:hypothetical protein